MIVLDASAWVDVATGVAPPGLVDVAANSGHWLVPEHFRLEAMNAVRGRWLGRQINDLQMDALTADIVSIDVDVWPTAPLLPRIRGLAANANAYDASYIALAEELGCPVVTADARLARIPGIRCRVIDFGRR